MSRMKIAKIRSRFFILLVIPTLLGSLWFFSPAYDCSPALVHEGPGSQPNPWFFNQRAFPQGRIPLDVWRSAQKDAAVMRDSAEGKAVSWTAEGPTNIGGRITDISVDPTNDNIVYAAAAEGGVLRSIDAGQTWTPLFDDMPSLSIGAIAIDPQNASVIYAGTGEVNPGGGSLAYGGTGIYKSTDQGGSWASLGLADSGSIGRIIIDPTDSDTIFVAVMGHLWQTGTERGVYRTTNGGTDWQRVLFVDDQTGAADIVQRPDNPLVLFAATWQRLRQPEYYDYGGPGCAIHRSTDGGDTWAIVAGGLPTPSTTSGRIGISLCESQPDVMHVIYADRTGYFDGVYRSINGGANWSRTTDTALDEVYASFGWWFGNVRTHPSDPDSIYVVGLELWRSTDGGASYFDATDTMHVDQHGLDFGPGATPILYAGNDGGVYRSTDSGYTWDKSPNLPITQTYRIALDPSNSDAIFIGAQDNGTPRTLSGALDDWENIFVGDGFQPVIHPLDSNLMWAQAQYGYLWHSSNGGNNWVSATIGINSADRIGWNAPHVQHPSDPDIRYFGTNKVYESTAARNWTSISSDLTGGEHQGNSGQVDGTITSISVSPVDSDVIWAGSDDGYVRVSVMGGGLWSDVSAGLPERWITSVRADPFVRETAYVTISGFRWTEALPHVYKTTDLGANWTPIAGNLPEAPVNDLLADPDTPNRYWVATDVGVYETVDGGTMWSTLGTGLPNVVVTSMVLDRSNQRLFIGTYGRSVFSLPIPTGLLFNDGFESGDLSLWSASAP